MKVLSELNLLKVRGVAAVILVKLEVLLVLVSLEVVFVKQVVLVKASSEEVSFEPLEFKPNLDIRLILLNKRFKSAVV